MTPHERVGLTFPGDGSSAATWSGIPRGLARGFAELGIAVEHVSTELPLLTKGASLSLALLRGGPSRAGGGLATLRRRRLAVSEASSELAALRSAVARRRCGRASVTALVQIGTGYSVPAIVPIATFEDTTIPQALAMGMEAWRVQRPAAVAARLTRQRRAYEQARACCTASTWAARSIVADHGIAAEKVHVVGLGRNLEPRPVRRDWERPRFLFVGRDWQRKGGPELLRGFERVRTLIPEAELDLVGSHPRIDAVGVRAHGPQEIQDAASRRRLEGLFERATCLVMPSRFEAFGIVHAEAGAAGVPSVGTSAGGAAEAIGPGGLVVPPGDQPALVQAMLELADPVTAARMGEAARRHSASLTWRAVASRIATALDPETDDAGGPPRYGYAADAPTARPPGLTAQSR